MINFNNGNTGPSGSDGHNDLPNEAAIETLQFEIATWEFNNRRFAMQFPSDFLLIKEAARTGVIPEFMVQDAAAHPVLLAAVQQLIERKLGPIFCQAHNDGAETSDACDHAYQAYAGAVPRLLRAYVEATPEKRAMVFGKWAIVPDMRVDEAHLLKLFDAGKLCSDDLVEGLSSPHGYKHTLRRATS